MLFLLPVDHTYTAKLSYFVKFIISCLYSMMGVLASAPLLWLKKKMQDFKTSTKNVLLKCEHLNHACSSSFSDT